jgi:hypothetical protein
MSEKPPQQQPLTVAKRLNKETLIGLWPLALVVAFAPILVGLYVRLEAPCYWSDFNYYEWATRFSIDQLTRNPLSYPVLLLSSVSLQHNLYFTVALVPLMALLGESRFAYVVSAAIVYLLPLAYLIARLAKNVMPKPGLSTGHAFLVVLTIPVLWAPPLRGYPDCGAALTMLLSMLLYLEDRSCQNCKKGAAIGFLLALTVLLRRYFAFAGVALVATILVDQVLLIRQMHRPAPEAVNTTVDTDQAGPVGDLLLASTPAKKLKTLLSLIGAGILTMICLGFPFLQNLTHLNYGVLNQSYQVPAITGAAYFFSCFGLFTLGLSAAGFLISWRHNLLNRAKTVIVLCVYLAAQLVWIIGPDELGTHYTLYFSPLVALGVVLFFSAVNTLSISKGKKIALLLPTLLLLVLNFCLSLAPAQLVDKTGLILFRPGMLSVADQEGRGPALFFSAGYAPYMRSDMDTLKTMVNMLRSHYVKQAAQAANHVIRAEEDATASPLAGRGQVNVAACSSLLNGETLRNAERSMFGLHNDKIEWLELPVADSKDIYPLERLLACRYLLVPSQNQYFIPPQGEKILACVKACFDQKWPLAQDFRELPVTYDLDGGLKVTVFERIRPTTPAIAALTLSKIKAFVGPEPGSQPTWITTGQMSLVCYDKARSQWQFNPGLDRPGVFAQEARYLLYVHDLPQRFKLSGQLISNRDAPAMTLKAQLLGEDGRMLDQVDLVGPTPLGEVTMPFTHYFGDNRQAKYLVLILDNATGPVSARANVTVDGLKVEAQQKH